MYFFSGASQPFSIPQLRILCLALYSILDLEDIILSEVTQSQKNTRDMYSLISRLFQKLRIPKIQFAKLMKFKRKEEQSVDSLSLLRRGNKMPMKGVTETKFRAETEGMTIRDCPTWGSIL